MSLKSFFKKNKKNDTPPLSPFLNHILLRINKLVEKVASDIMIPRVDAVTLHIGQPLEEALEIIRKNGHSRFPVWKDKLDNIVGILYLKDILYQIQKKDEKLVLSEEKITQSMLRESFFIPESKKVESLLKEFQAKKIHMAVVIDEYGGFSGIVTLEDVLEVIIGDIQDEYDFEEVSIKKINEEVYEVDARTSLEELEETLAIDFGEYKEEIDTIGGLIYNRIERVPKIGEEIKIDHIVYQVIKKEGNKILTLKLKLMPQDNDDHRE